ncbi:hypothetical protein AtubIFM55763_010843 [Aspergillus tubingensis]|nr:hypothetical protein AtubIFM55763_010843 [Aspergillus tubingensis]GLA90610.1 hypothetical protein AtubIFM57143_000216 [Aspergillus tubingensis]GLB18894.1 hypothetical protein AtubIFM61612_008791 [Aspergillus tubingensis]
MNHDGVRLDYNIVLQRKLFEEKSPYETCKFVHEVYKDIVILTGYDQKPSTKLRTAVILDCVTSSLYTATYGARGNRLPFIIAENKREYKMVVESLGGLVGVIATQKRDCDFVYRW